MWRVVEGCGGRGVASQRSDGEQGARAAGDAALADALEAEDDEQQGRRPRAAMGGRC